MREPRFTEVMITDPANCIQTVFKAGGERVKPGKEGPEGSAEPWARHCLAGPTG